MKMEQLMLGFLEAGSRGTTHWPPKRDCRAGLGCLQCQMLMERSHLLYVAVLAERRGLSFCLIATFPLYDSGKPQNLSREMKRRQKKHFTKAAELKSPPHSTINAVTHLDSFYIIILLF